ncbi:MAG TPA: hypothetical protein VF173_10610 [Thermoanaerobaculia bacterium]|nr:hypothetical protein [Thermoanaerobaculia bacterium]
MLSFACRRFRARFTPGANLPHRRACPGCEAYAAAIEQAAGRRLPVPASLRRNLRALAAPEPGAVLPFPVPRLPMPAALASRLSAIPRTSQPARPVPPEWIRNPRFAVAASVVLALLLGPVLAGAADRGQQALQRAHEEVTPLLEGAGAEGHRELARLRLAAAAAYDGAHEAAANSVRRARAELSNFTVWLSSTTEDLMNRVPRHESRRDR